MFLFTLLAAASVCLAAPVAVVVEKRAAAPTVTIANGTVIGTTTDSIDTFKGIPFAQPPTGTLRLKPPQTITSAFGTITATSAAACPQFAGQVDSSNIPNDILGELADTPFLQTVLDESEDCLFMIVQRPTGTTEDDALPVVFWIFGGGFEAGWAGMYDGSDFVAKSVSLGKPVIFVAVSYRVGGFGFLAGSDLAAEHSTNLGLRDQRLGLEWVADNIAAFGGDATKVTLWGESAGAISAFDHTIINGGDNTYNGQALFRGAIMDSGSVTPADPVTASQAQAIYDRVLEEAGCDNSDDALACLRALDYETFLNAVNSVPWIFSYSSIDLSYLPRPDPGDDFFPESPEVPLRAGNVAKVPVINGDQEDEGTLFALVQSNITTNAELIAYLVTFFPNNDNAVSDVTGLVATYPDEPLLGQPDGSPFNSGILYNIYPEYKRLAAILGDITFTLARRGYLSTLTSYDVPAWSYLSTYLRATSILGTFHFSDILFAFGILGEDSVPAETYQTYYISFINDLDPNTISTESPLIEWPQWSNASGSPQLLDLGADGNTLITDDFRSATYAYLESRTSDFRV